MAEETARRTRSMLPFTLSFFLLAIAFLSATNGSAANDIVQNGVNVQIAVVMIPPNVTKLNKLTINALHLAIKNAKLRGTRSFTNSIRSYGDEDGSGGGGGNTAESGWCGNGALGTKIPYSLC